MQRQFNEQAPADLRIERRPSKWCNPEGAAPAMPVLTAHRFAIIHFQQIQEAEDGGLTKGLSIHRLDSGEEAEIVRIDQHLLHQNF